MIAKITMITERDANTSTITRKRSSKIMTIMIINTITNMIISMSTSMIMGMVMVTDMGTDTAMDIMVMITKT